MKTCKDCTKGGELKKGCVKGSAPLKTTFISLMGGKGGSKPLLGRHNCNFFINKRRDGDEKEIVHWNFDYRPGSFHFAAAP
jgi:hypothetical protein